MSNPTAWPGFAGLVRHGDIRPRVHQKTPNFRTLPHVTNRMSHTDSRFLVSTAILLLTFATANAQTAGKYERFAHRPNAESWNIYDYADQNYYFPAWDSAGNGQNADIYFTFAGSGALDFYADQSSSGGAFTGNLVTAGVDAIGCDIYVQDIASFNTAEFFLFSAATGRYYVSELITPAASGWDTAYASLTQDVWYFLENNVYKPTKLTPAILANVTEIGVTFYPLDVPDANGKIVALDNFTFYGAFLTPELTTATSGSSFQLGFDRRPGIAYSIVSAPDLTTWSPVPDHEFITGTTPYTMTLPLTPTARFFKVGIEDDLTPVPNIPAP